MFRQIAERLPEGAKQAKKEAEGREREGKGNQKFPSTVGIR
jgi:hypothetical protein